MKYLILLTMLLTASASADEPPSYTDYEIKSSNNQYLAKISCTLCNFEEHWQQKFKLSIFDANGNQLWEKKYHHFGYPQGYLANDGELFVYLEYWYFENDPVLAVYTKNKTIKYNGKDFDFDKSKLVKTESHQLWLDNDKGLQVHIEKDGYLITFFTIDNKKQTIHITR